MSTPQFTSNNNHPESLCHLGGNYVQNRSRIQAILPNPTLISIPRKIADMIQIGSILWHLKVAVILHSDNGKNQPTMKGAG